MRRLLALPLLILTVPALADGAHDGVIKVRTGPEPSDIALAIFAAAAIWFVRRQLRKRLPRDPR